MRVLDVGCGVGGPAREIARFADVNIVGLNNNEYQVGRANKYTQKAGLGGQVECELFSRERGKEGEGEGEVEVEEERMLKFFSHLFSFFFFGHFQS